MLRKNFCNKSLNSFRHTFEAGYVFQRSPDLSKRYRLHCSEISIVIMERSAGIICERFYLHFFKKMLYYRVKRG